MRRVILLIIFIVVIVPLKAQMKLNIENIVISNYHVDFSQEEMDEDMENGPYVHFQCYLRNHGDSIKINPSKVKVIISFFYNRTLYTDELIIFPWNYSDEKSVMIDKDGVKFECGTLIMNVANLFEDKKGDYRELLLKIIPTVKIIFEESENNVMVISDNVLDVTLK